MNLTPSQVETLFFFGEGGGKRLGNSLGTSFGAPKKVYKLTGKVPLFLRVPFGALQIKRSLRLFWARTS